MIISLSGPSGVGKAFVKERLLMRFPAISEIPWFTTRLLRSDELGGNRVSLPPSAFGERERTGDLILVQDLYGHRYGLSRNALLPSLGVRLIELHPDNLRQALDINPDILTIGLVVFDLSLLRERLSTRKTEGQSEIEQRIAAAEQEVRSILGQREIFTSVIEVSRESEATVFDQVLAVVSSQLQEKGEGNEPEYTGR